MLKAVVLALVLANAAFFAWTQGGLDGLVGVRSIGDREPERLARQVRPESIRIAAPQAASATPATQATPAAPVTPITPAAPVPLAASAAPVAALLCLEAGPFAAASINAAENALRAAMPAAGSASWSSIKTEVPGAWIIYMGRYLNPELLARKQDELMRRKVAFEPVSGAAALEPGLSLGRFESRSAATQSLEQLALLGIHTAKVVELVAPTSTHRLRIERADAALAERLAAVKAGALVGRPFVPCAAVAAGSTAG